MEIILIIFALFMLPVLVFSPTWIASIAVLILVGVGALIGSIILVAIFSSQAIGLGIITAIALTIVSYRDRKRSIL